MPEVQLSSKVYDRMGYIRKLVDSGMSLAQIKSSYKGKFRVRPNHNQLRLIVGGLKDKNLDVFIKEPGGQVKHKVMEGGAPIQPVPPPNTKKGVKVKKPKSKRRKPRVPVIRHESAVTRIELDELVSKLLRYQDRMGSYRLSMDKNAILIEKIPQEASA